MVGASRFISWAKALGSRMEHWDHSRSPASIRLLLDFGRTHGLQPATLLSGANLTLEQLSHAEAWVTPSQELAVIANMLRTRPHLAGLGLRLGLAYHPSAFGVLGLGLMSSATPFEALVWGHRFLSLTYTFMQIGYVIDADLVRISFRPPKTLSPDIQAFLAGRAVGAVARIVGDVAGSLSAVRRVSLRGGEPSAIVRSELRDDLGVEPEWNATEDTLVLTLGTLQQPSLQANATTAAMCQRMCEDLIETSRARLDNAGLVRELLAAMPDGRMPRLADLASLLCLSERSLKRRFKAEGVSFRALLRENRRTRAELLLANPANSLTDIASRLGFSDLSSFSQAYRRWTGVAPSLVRAADPGLRRARGPSP
jgi:AraC-like DNA-binding protein